MNERIEKVAMKHINRKSFVIAVRTLGWIYLILIFLNTIFFYNQFLYKTFLSSGFFGIVAGGLINYKIDWKQKPLTIRILLICLDILIFLFVSWKIMRYEF